MHAILGIYMYFYFILVLSFLVRLILPAFGRCRLLDSWVFSDGLLLMANHNRLPSPSYQFWVSSGPGPRNDGRCYSFL